LATVDLGGASYESAQRMKIACSWGIEAGCPARRLAWLGLVGSLACAGCIRVSFVKSSGSFVEHETKKRPGVYVDKLPRKPYESVGIIEVMAPQTTDLGQIMDAAADKGQEVGCDVVVDRSIHKVDGSLHRHWTVALSGPAASPAEAPRPWRRDAQYLGAGFTPAPLYQPAHTVTYTPGYAPPPDKREFICGVWSDDDSGDDDK
jgi:hypothetical protein